MHAHRLKGLHCILTSWTEQGHIRDAKQWKAESRGTSQRFSLLLSRNSSCVLCVRVCVCVCFLECMRMWSRCCLAGWCGTTESVTNQTEKPQWVVPNLIVWQGWTVVHRAVPQKKEQKQRVPSLKQDLGYWQFQTGKEEAAAACVITCVLMHQTRKWSIWLKLPSKSHLFFFYIYTVEMSKNKSLYISQKKRYFSSVSMFTCTSIWSFWQ